MSDEQIDLLRDQAIALLGSIALNAEEPQQRLRSLITHVCWLIQADVWIWTHGQNTPPPQPPVCLALMQDGFTSEEWAGWVRFSMDPDMVRLVRLPALKLAQRGPCTVLLEDYADLEAVQRAGLRHRLQRETHLAHLMVHVLPLNDCQHIGVGLHRRADKSPYRPAEVRVAHLVLCAVGPLLGEARSEVPGPLIHTSPRGRQVLMLLLEGDSRKQIAAKLQLSRHTINDYFKDLCHRFGVNSSSELIARLHGTRGPNP